MNVPAAPADPAQEGERVGAGTVFLVAGRLGLTSFGGPVAHIGYFRDEYVARRRWVSDEDFADLVGLSQFLPGPASSQLGIAIGTIRAGVRGGLAAWAGFTLPSAVALVALALVGGRGLGDQGWVRGLQLVAVAVVAHAVWSMARTLTPDLRRGVIAVGAAALLVAWGSALAQIVVIGAGAAIGAVALRGLARGRPPRERLPVGVTRRAAAGWLVAFAALLVALPLARQATDSHAVAMADGYYRTGALVFGGGHVVLPLLEEQVVEPGWVAPEDFLAGYGAAQAVPGPLFTFSAYLGAVQDPDPNGVPGAALALAAIFLPSFLLVFGTLPFWGVLRARPGAMAAMAGINAAVVGLLAAALYDPVFTEAVNGPADLAIALAAFVALARFRVAPWVVVVACALIGAAAL